MEHKPQTIDGITYEPIPWVGCSKCDASLNGPLCNKLYEGDNNLNCSGIVWIKVQEKSVVTNEINSVPTFSEAQIKYLQEVFQIDATQEVLPVKDGFVKKGDLVWRRGARGPEDIRAENVWDNIKEFSQYYSIEEPKYKIVYED